MALYTKNTPGAPVSGQYALSDQVVDSVGVTWTCIQAGLPGVFMPGGFKLSTNGTIASTTGLTGLELGDGILHQTVFTFAAVPLTIADATVGVGSKIYDFPEGRIYIVGATGTMAFTTTSVLASTLNASVSCRWGVGTTTQVNATLATTEQDILPVTTFTSSATINVANTATTAALASPAVFDGTGTAKDAFFNISVPTATDIDADATVTCTGNVIISWIFLGDY